MDGISKETFEQMDADSKLNVLFDYAVTAFETAKALDEKVDDLNKKALKWGGVGGIAAAIAGYLASLFINHISK